MPTRRSYQDSCGIARALDVVGERWALLVVRELLFGPQRFSDLRRGLPGASSNLVSDRLRELQGHGVLRRRLLPAPAASQVYELTDRGRELEPIVLALGDWGLKVPIPAGPTTVGATSMLIYLRAAARLDPRVAPADFRFELDGRVWAVRTERGRVRVASGEPTEAIAGIRTDPKTLNELLTQPALLDAGPDLAGPGDRGISQVGFGGAGFGGAAEITGDRRALRWLMSSVSAPVQE